MGVKKFQVKYIIQKEVIKNLAVVLNTVNS